MDLTYFRINIIIYDNSSDDHLYYDWAHGLPHRFPSVCLSAKIERRWRGTGGMMTQLKETLPMPANPSTPIANDVLICLRKIIQSHYLYSHFLIKKVGLTGSQLAVLQEIHKKKETTVGQIAKAISLSQATVTGIIERLEKRGLVLRVRSQADRRMVFVNPTPEGTRLLDNAPPLLRESFVADFNGLQDWEKTMILSSLLRLVQMMDAKNIKPGPIVSDESIRTLENHPFVQ